jgi:hypothetical protein
MLFAEQYFKKSKPSKDGNAPTEAMFKATEWEDYRDK